MKKLLLATTLSCLFFGCEQSTKEPATTHQVEKTPIIVKKVKRHAITMAAKTQIGKTTSYNPAYVGLSYPNGDVPIESGVCTDVIVRALRSAYKMDLQRLIHEDMKQNFSKYPKIWGLKRPDKNIDHRRVPNIKTFFERRGYTVSTKNKKFLDGDIVTCIVGRNLAHIMIVSHEPNTKKRAQVIHNIGSGAKEADDLYRFKITGHYRIPKPTK